MKIILDEIKKDGVLIKEDGTEIGRYSYKNLLDEYFTIDDFKKDLDCFNKTLSMQDEFNDIKKLYDYVKIHNFGE